MCVVGGGAVAWHRVIAKGWGKNDASMQLLRNFYPKQSGSL